MANAKKFNQAFIREVAKMVEDSALEKMDKVTLLIHSKLVAATPVDLGQARAGWNIELNEMDTSAPKKPPKGTRLPAPESRIGNKAKKGSDAYHISNFVSHIVYLNEGSSENASKNFVEAAIISAYKQVK